jgi:hypothetical protein
MSVGKDFGKDSNNKDLTGGNTSIIATTQPSSPNQYNENLSR